MYIYIVKYVTVMFVYGKNRYVCTIRFYQGTNSTHNTQSRFKLHPNFIRMWDSLTLYSHIIMIF